MHGFCITLRSNYYTSSMWLHHLREYDLCDNKFVNYLHLLLLWPHRPWRLSEVGRGAMSSFLLLAWCKYPNWLTSVGKWHLFNDHSLCVDHSKIHYTSHLQVTDQNELCEHACMHHRWSKLTSTIIGLTLRATDNYVSLCFKRGQQKWCLKVRAKLLNHNRVKRKCMIFHEHWSALVLFLLLCTRTQRNVTCCR